MMAASLRQLILGGGADDATEEDADHPVVDATDSPLEESSSSSSEDEASSTKKKKDSSLTTQKRKRVRPTVGPSRKTVGPFVDRLFASHSVRTGNRAFVGRLAELGVSSASDGSVSWRYLNSRQLWDGDNTSRRVAEDLRATVPATCDRACDRAETLGTRESREVAVRLLASALRSMKAYDGAVVACAVRVARIEERARETVLGWLRAMGTDWKRAQYSSELKARDPRQSWYRSRSAPPTSDQRADLLVAAIVVAWVSGRGRAVDELLMLCAQTAPHRDDRTAVAVAACRAIAPLVPVDACLDVYDDAECDALFASLDDAARREAAALLRESRALDLAARAPDTRWSAVAIALAALVADDGPDLARQRVECRLARRALARRHDPDALIDWLRVEPAAARFGLDERAVDVLESLATVPALAAAVHAAYFVCNDPDVYRRRAPALWRALAKALDDDGPRLENRKLVFFSEGHDSLWRKFFFLSPTPDDLFDDGILADEEENDDDDIVADDPFDDWYLTGLPAPLLLLGYKYLVAARLYARDSLQPATRRHVLLEAGRRPGASAFFRAFSRAVLGGNTMPLDGGGEGGRRKSVFADDDEEEEEEEEGQEQQAEPPTKKLKPSS